ARRAAAGARALRLRHRKDEPRLIVEVRNGDLQFEHRPLMLGHYASARLLTTEALMDGFVGNAMSLSLRAGLYPVEIGSHQVFLNAYQDPRRGVLMPRPEAVIVAGL